MTTTNGAFTALEAENAMLRQRISELEARLASHDGNALSTCQGRFTFDPHRRWKLTHPGD